MAARIAEIDPTTAVPIIELPVLRISRMAAIGQSGLLQSLKNGVEFGIAHMKGIVMGLERIILVEIEREPVIHPHRSKMPGWTVILETEDIGKESRRLFLVPRRHDRMIQFDRHGNLTASLF